MATPRHKAEVADEGSDHQKDCEDYDGPTYFLSVCQCSSPRSRRSAIKVAYPAMSRQWSAKFH